MKATVTNLAEIREYGKNTNLINYKLTMGEWKEAFYVMSKHQIIEVPGAIRMLRMRLRFISTARSIYIVEVWTLLR